MKTVIIVDPDELSRRRQANVVTHLRHRIVGASNLQAVPKEHLLQSATVILAAASLGTDPLLSLIAEPDVKAQLVVVGAPRNGSQRLRRFARFVEAPWQPEELARVLVEALRAPVELESIRLVDLLRDLHQDRSTARIVIDSAPAGEIVVVAGELVHAERAHSSGLAALKDMLRQPGGSARVLPIHGIPQTIAGDFKSTLLGILEQLDDVNPAR